MGLVQELNNFIQKSKQDVFIEAEGKPNFHSKDGIPAGLTVTHNDAYRGNYSYSLIFHLFKCYLLRWLHPTASLLRSAALQSEN